MVTALLLLKVHVRDTSLTEAELMLKFQGPSLRPGSTLPQFHTENLKEQERHAPGDPHHVQQ
jgi:hypothetical protein